MPHIYWMEIKTEFLKLARMRKHSGAEATLLCQAHGGVRQVRFADAGAAPDQHSGLAATGHERQ